MEAKIHCSSKCSHNFLRSFSSLNTETQPPLSCTYKLSPALQLVRKTFIRLANRKDWQNTPSTSMPFCLIYSGSVLTCKPASIIKNIHICQRMMSVLGCGVWYVSKYPHYLKEVCMCKLYMNFQLNKATHFENGSFNGQHQSRHLSAVRLFFKC